MTQTRFARILGLCLILGAASAFMGCGAQSRQVELDKEDDNGMLVARKGIRSYNKQHRETGNKGSANSKSAPRRGN